MDKFRQVCYKKSMKKLFYLLIQEGAFNVKVSDSLNLCFYENDGQIDVEMSQNNKLTHISNVSYQHLANLLKIPEVDKALAKEFDDALDLHYEKKSTLNQMLSILEHKENISPKNKQLLKSIFELTAKTNHCKLTDNIWLELQTCLGTRPMAGFELHFQICAEKNYNRLYSYLMHDNQTLSNNLTNIQTLAILHKCILHHPKQIKENVDKLNMENIISATNNLTRYTKLKNNYFEVVSEK